MNITLWIVQALLTLVFLAAGIVKMTRSKEQLAGRIRWVEDFSPVGAKLTYKQTKLPA